MTSPTSRGGVTAPAVVNCVPLYFPFFVKLLNFVALNPHGCLFFFFYCYDYLTLRSLACYYDNRRLTARPFRFDAFCLFFFIFFFLLDTHMVGDKLRWTTRGKIDRILKWNRNGIMAESEEQIDWIELNFIVISVIFSVF